MLHANKLDQLLKPCASSLDHFNQTTIHDKHMISTLPATSIYADYKVYTTLWRYNSAYTTHTKLHNK